MWQSHRAAPQASPLVYTAREKDPHQELRCLCCVPSRAPYRGLRSSRGRRCSPLPLILWPGLGGNILGLAPCSPRWPRHPATPLGLAGGGEPWRPSLHQSLAHGRGTAVCQGLAGVPLPPPPPRVGLPAGGAPVPPPPAPLGCPSLGETPPGGFSIEGGGHLNWGGVWGAGVGGGFPPVLGGGIITFGGVLWGEFSLHFRGGFSLYGGFFSPCSGGVSPLGFCFSRFCQFIQKKPVFTGYCTEATSLHPPLAQHVLHVCFMVQSRVVVVVSPLTLVGLGGCHPTRCVCVLAPSLCEPEIMLPEDRLLNVYMLCCT